MSITKLSITELRKKLKKKEFSALELTESYLNEIKKHNQSLNAFVEVTEEKAIEMAKESDKKLASGKAGILEGIPLGIKDNYCVKNVRTQSASKILQDFVPPYESTVTQNLWDAGAIMLGKLNMDEFAMGSANINSCYGPAVSPLNRSSDDKELVPGGSSGGSSAAVRGFLCAGATGSDTGGSIRQPAAFTANVGIKPTYGSCSRWGIIAFASSLDQAGPIARSVSDAALMLEAMVGFDPKDSTSIERKDTDFSASLNAGVKGLKIGVPKEYRSEGLRDSVIKAWDDSVEMLKKAGAEIVDISLPHTEYASPTYYIIATAEASSNLARFDGVRYGLRVASEGDSLKDMYEKTRSEGFGDEVKRRIMIGTYVLSSGYYDAYYKKAQRVRRLILNDFNNAFEKVDLILTPSTPTSAFAFSEKPSTLEMYHNDVFTVSANLAGLPAISVPAELDGKNLPLGVQLIGPAFSEKTIFSAAKVIEDEANFPFDKLIYRI